MMNAVLEHMRHWWADTLFKRLFLLMWLGLVASHLLAFSITTQVHKPPGATPRGIGHVPVLPSLPPMGSGMGNAPPPPPDDAQRQPPPAVPDGPPDRASPGDDGGLPASALWLDYGIRFVAIGLVAWFGARWLSEPMRRLADASERLGQVLGHRSGHDGAGRSPPPQLDASRGTLEVRQTAQVFNTMAQRLHEQFDAQDLLMAAISHDLRTPLARLQVRLDAMTPPAQAGRCIADVQEMDQLIGSVLEMVRGRQSGGERQRLDLGALAQSLVDDLAEQGHAASMAGTPEAPVLVVAQPQALRRVLGNLIGNALRYGGAARVAIAADGPEVRLTIDDDGPGIAPHQLDAVFAPFYRASSSVAPRDDVQDAGVRGAGAGLGLYIARDLAARNGGRLSLVNRAEGGLRAELVLPRA
jgi:signal transduction histidine kinase